jgi:thymidylate synthase (FAD)
MSKRAISEGLEPHLFNEIPVLDHGFIRVVDYMGNDDSIVQAARVSYGSGTKTVSEDKALIDYLMRHWHTTPFEMCEIKLHVKLPIFVARQWIRHRTASVNEVSARYSVLDKEFYVPKAENMRAQSEVNKQCGGDVLPAGEAQASQSIIRDVSNRAYFGYENLMNEGDGYYDQFQGLSREQSRMVLPTNFYTQWYWKIDLHNLMHFLMLRADSHAQFEIREYANVICDLVKKWVPMAYAAFEEHRLNGNRLSATGLSVVQRMLAGEEVTHGTSGLGKREWGELQEMLSPKV